jgi:hypothetical protein
MRTGILLEDEATNCLPDSDCLGIEKAYQLNWLTGFSVHDVSMTSAGIEPCLKGILSVLHWCSCIVKIETWTCISSYVEAQLPLATGKSIL